MQAISKGSCLPLWNVKSRGGKKDRDVAMLLLLEEQGQAAHHFVDAVHCPQSQEELFRNGRKPPFLHFFGKPAAQNYVSVSMNVIDAQVDALLQEFFFTYLH